jgi:hypothetical protein
LIKPLSIHKQEAAGISAEERCGFENVKTFFEIPHWMHLSFVEYDSNPSRSCDSARRPHNGSLWGETTKRTNGFVAVSGGSSFEEGLPASSPKRAAKENGNHYQRDLISSRDFEDVLEACRPRYRAYDDIAHQLPSALKSLMKIKTHGVDRKPNSPDRDSRACNRPGFTTEHLPEWGHVEFEASRDRMLKAESCQGAREGFSPYLLPGSVTGTSGESHILASSCGSSHVSNPSPWVLKSSEMANRPMQSDTMSGYLLALGLQIQKSMSVGSPMPMSPSSADFPKHVRHPAGGPIDGKCLSAKSKQASLTIDSLRAMMTKYDASVSKWPPEGPRRPSKR